MPFVFFHFLYIAFNFFFCVRLQPEIIKERYTYDPTETDKNVLDHVGILKETDSEVFVSNWIWTNIDYIVKIDRRVI